MIRKLLNGDIDRVTDILPRFAVLGTAARKLHSGKSNKNMEIERPCRRTYPLGQGI